MWQRQVQDRSLDSLPDNMKYENKSLPFKDGHKSILSTPTHEGQGTPLSTCTESYMLPEKLKVRTGGKKKELMERALYAQVAKELQEEVEEPPPMPEYKSVTQKDFDVEGFVSELPPPELEHNIANEQPITFWTQHKQKIPVSFSLSFFIHLSLPGSFYQNVWAWIQAFCFFSLIHSCFALAEMSSYWIFLELLAYCMFLSTLDCFKRSINSYLQQAFV